MNLLPIERDLARISRIASSRDDMADVLTELGTRGHLSGGERGTGLCDRRLHHLERRPA